MNTNPTFHYTPNNKQQKRFKKVIGVQVNSNLSVNLSDKKEEFLKKFKEKNFVLEELNILPKKNLKRIKITGAGIDIIASNYIYAIILNQEGSPKIILSGTNKNKSKSTLNVGMNIEELEKIFTNSRYTDKVNILNTNDYYRYYYDIGLAVKFDDNFSTVKEFVITQLPE